MQRHLLKHVMTACLWLTFAAGLVAAEREDRQRHRRANIPPTLEIEVLDPNADPQGVPAVELKQGPNGLEVDIPPVVLVHRYYYSGDRSFQAQFLPGGPSIIVASHPKTGERSYIEVQMPPGAPLVTYTSHSIEYDFGEQGISICFWPLLKPKAVYRNGIGVTTKVARATRRVGGDFSRLVQRTGIPEHTSKIAEGTGAAVNNTIDFARDTTEMALLPIKQIACMTPLGGFVQPAAEDQATRLRDNAVRNIGEERTRAEASIRTIR